MKKSQFFVLAVLMIAAFVLAACPAATPAPTTSDTASSGGDTTASTGGDTAASCECTDPKGCVTVGANDPVRVGWMMVVSGADATLGLDSKYGAEIAADDRGTIAGHAIELVGEDDLCSAEGGQTAAQKMSADSKLTAVIGTSCSSAARAAIPVMCNAGIPMISASNTAPDLTAADRPADYWCYMRTAHNDLVQGAAMAEYAYGAGYRKAATVHDGSLYADQLQQVFADKFKELGGEIVAQEAVGPQDTDMKPMLTRVAAAGPDFLYYPIFVAAGGQVTKQAKEVPGLEGVQLAGADGIFSPDFLKAAGDAALGMNHSSPDFSAFGAEYPALLEKYEAKYNTKPLSAFHAHAYDAFNIIANGIEAVAQKCDDGSLVIGKQALRDAMISTKDFAGITGNLTCTETGDCADPKIAVYEVMNADPETWDPGATDTSNPKKIWP
ncbi:MAG: branched-chain amino acid ABC transporter substrate-binding protein [Caldilineales bacterium]